MPLYELGRMAKANGNSSQDLYTPSLHGTESDDLCELVWENGQILTQGHSNAPKILPSQCLPSFSPRGRGKNPEIGKFGELESVMDDIPMSVPSSEMGLHQDDDQESVPWLSYAMNDHSHHHGYSSELLPELSVVTSNYLHNRNSFSQMDKSSSYSSALGNSHKNSGHGGGVAILDSRTSRLHQSSSLQSRTSITSHRPREVEIPSNSSSTLMNFSHFARPAALLRNNLQSLKAKEFAAGSNHIPTSKPVEVNNGDANESTTKATKQTSKQSEHVNQADAAKDAQPCSQIPVRNPGKGVTEGEKSLEPVVASSSVCSANNVKKKASDAPIQHKKRRSRDDDESDCNSEDVEEESRDVKKVANARGGPSSKRSRAAEVHNLSERRRRDRINEKMRALQELIPNCNKVDKASMLDEAIEYLKTLQLQVQMMSMGAGVYMPQMIFPNAMHHMPSFQPMRVGMHMGFGLGYGITTPHDMNGSSSSYPMMQLPTVQGNHFPALPRPVSTGLHGMTGSNLQVFGHPSQGFPVSSSDGHLVSGVPPAKSGELNGYEAEVHLSNMDSRSVPGIKDSTGHISSQGTLTSDENIELNQPNQM